MQTIYPFRDDIENTAEPGMLPTMPAILFADFENVQTSNHEALAEDSFIIDNLSKASWAVSKILEAENRISQRSELAKEFKARIDLWLESANRQDTDSISYLSILLEPYVQEEVSKLHNSKSLSLPTGIASLRKLPDHLDITDSPMALAYCETEHPEAVIIKKELDKSILKDLIFRQAEPVPGVEAELGYDKLYIKPLKIRSIA
jgi:hypothetical protein